MAERLSRLGKLSLIIAWAAVFILMPITSFPLLAHLAGGTSVAPAAFLPLIWVALFWFIPYLLKEEPYREKVYLSYSSSQLPLFPAPPPFF